MTHRPVESSTRDPRGQEGSAYLIALLVLFLLSVIGLSLAFVTQTEMEIGSNERIIQRIFYAADGGVAIATAKVLVTNDHREAVYDLAEPGTTLDIRNVLNLAPVVPVNDAPCNLCEINNTGTYQEKAYRKIGNAITVEAVRTAGRGGRRLAAKTVASMLEVQPWKSPLDAYLPIGDEAAMARVKK